MAEDAMKDFFISYNKADRNWAEWIAWQLEAEGYRTVIQSWDFRVGSNFVLNMSQAASTAKRTIAVLSPEYLSSLYTQPEWAAAFVQDPEGREGRLLPVRVRQCKLLGLLSAIVYLDLVDLGESDARAKLLAGVGSTRAKPTIAPLFPGRIMRSSEPIPHFPGSQTAQVHKGSPQDLKNMYVRVDEIWAGRIATSTRHMYGRDIAAYDQFTMAKGLDPLDKNTLGTWRDEMVQHSSKSPKTINRMLSAVRNLIREAEKLNMVESGLATKFEMIPMVKEKALKERLKQHSRTPISPEDMRRLCESPNIKTLVGMRDRALLATLASSGVKASELASLKKSQIVKKDGGYQLTVRGKTDSDYRDAALSQEAYSLIVKWLEKRSIDSPYVFTAFAGKGDRSLDTPISESGLWKCVVKYAKKCGLQNVKPHDLRRFVGTQLAATGDLRKVQKALGHKHISVTAKQYELDQLPVGMTDNLY